jgi:hypothetical protein
MLQTGEMIRVSVRFMVDSDSGSLTTYQSTGSIGSDLTAL